MAQIQASNLQLLVELEQLHFKAAAKIRVSLIKHLIKVQIFINQ